MQTSNPLTDGRADTQMQILTMLAGFEANVISSFSAVYRATAKLPRKIKKRERNRLKKSFGLAVIDVLEVIFQEDTIAKHPQVISRVNKIKKEITKL